MLRLFCHLVCKEFVFYLCYLQILVFNTFLYQMSLVSCTNIMTNATSGTETHYPSGTPELTPVLVDFALLSFSFLSNVLWTRDCPFVYSLLTIAFLVLHRLTAYEASSLSFSHSWFITRFVTRLRCATSGAGPTYPFGAHEFTPGFQWSSCYSIFSFMCTFCISLFVLFFWPLCCLSFDWWILTTPLV